MVLAETNGAFLFEKDVQERVIQMELMDLRAERISGI
jgi:hypothetical protein